ncbi:hypothetical protein F4824DRAFT_279550 [Ustulina deusta]|nr:hypothetical protein F4824DRAFT_279550 [Ustulina deusta]
MYKWPSRIRSLVVARLLSRLRNVPSSKPTNRREITYLIGMAEEDDRRPESSPFAGFTTQVYFHEGPEFVVPTSLIRKCPKLIPDGTRWPPSAIRLDDVASHIAHVIFYYLLTGSYQSLRPKGSSHHERLGNELRTGVQAYNAARNYELPALQELAKDEIQRLAQELPFPLVLNLLRNLHLDPGEREAWLDDYVQSGLKDLFRTPTAFLDLTASQVEHDVVSFSNIILKSLANLLSNDVALARKDNVATTPTLSPEPAAIEEEPAREDEPVLAEVLAGEEEPVYVVEILQETREPAPSEQEREASPIVEPEPTVYEPTYEHVHETQRDPEEPAYNDTPELQEVEPEPEPEIEPAHEVKYSPTEYALSPTTWDWGGSTSKPKQDSFWPDDEPLSSPAEPVESPPAEVLEITEVPAEDDTPGRVEYPEPMLARDFSLVLEHQPASSPTDDDVPPLEETKPAVVAEGKKKKKKSSKTLSIFRNDEERSPEPAPEPEPQPQPQPQVDIPRAESSDSKAMDEAALLSAASSSGVAPTKSKKKKKRLIFRTEGLL